MSCFEAFEEKVADGLMVNLMMNLQNSEIRVIGTEDCDRMKPRSLNTVET